MIRHIPPPPPPERRPLIALEDLTGGPYRANPEPSKEWLVGEIASLNRDCARLVQELEEAQHRARWREFWQEFSRGALGYFVLILFVALLAAILSGRAHAQANPISEDQGPGVAAGALDGDAEDVRSVEGGATAASSLRDDPDAPGRGPDRGGEVPAILTFDQRELALSIARVAYNEAHDSEGDLEMIAQIVLAHGETDRARLAWLVRHSPCVTGRISQDAAYARPGPCRWTRNLEPSGAKPRGWLDTDGPWAAHRERWRAHLRRAVAYVTGARAAAFCSVIPDTWDGMAWRTERLATGRFEEIKCRRQTRNVPYRYVRGGGVS